MRGCWCVVVTTAALAILGSRPARGFEAYEALVPCTATAENPVGTIRGCITCHDNADGGGGCPSPPCLGPFGVAFNAQARVWDPTLAAMDSDGDGFTNGEELADLTGAWTVGGPAAACVCVTSPGLALLTPGDADGDDDGVCCRGADTSDDGDCLDRGEHDDSFDCDDEDPSTSSEAVERCNDGIDNDCDGEVDTDAGPGEPEVCNDGHDNDCDGDPDADDDDCVELVDGDDDGYCPGGFDLDGDGSCVDVDEDAGPVDCDDNDDDVHPDAEETCADGAVDRDCDGVAAEEDTACDDPPIGGDDEMAGCGCGMGDGRGGDGFVALLVLVGVAIGGGRRKRRQESDSRRSSPTPSPRQRSRSRRRASRCGR